MTMSLNMTFFYFEVVPNACNKLEFPTKYHQILNSDKTSSLEEKLSFLWFSDLDIRLYLL